MWTLAAMMAQGGPMQFPDGKGIYDQDPDLLSYWHVIWAEQETERKSKEAKEKNKKGRKKR